MIFTIKKNNHYANFWFGFTRKDKITYECTLTDSCLYNIDGVDSYDINKLIGFSTTLNHHNQSARIGWRCRDNKTFEILTYNYEAGVRDTTDTILGIVLPNRPFVISIEDVETSYIYTFTQGTTTKTVYKDKKPDKVWFKWILKPFFGGNNTAPHQMNFIINKID